MMRAVGVGVVVVVRHFGFGDSCHNYVHPSLATAPLGLWPWSMSNARTVKCHLV